MTSRDALENALTMFLAKSVMHRHPRDIEIAKRLNEILQQKGEFDGGLDMTLCDYIDTVIDG